MVLQLDTLQDVSNIPFLHIVLHAHIGEFFSIDVQITSQDPSISIDWARTLVLFQQNETGTNDGYYTVIQNGDLGLCISQKQQSRQ